MVSELYCREPRRARFGRPMQKSLALVLRGRSERRHELVRLSADALETEPRRAHTGQQTAADLISGDRIPEKLFDHGASDRCIARTTR